MFPLTFTEFLTATGNQKASDIILAPPEVVPELIYDMLLIQINNVLMLLSLQQPDLLDSKLNMQDSLKAFLIQQ
jgi:hypothetical protein